MNEQLLAAAKAVKSTKSFLNKATSTQKEQALYAIADALEKNTDIILAANALDVAAAKEKGISPSLIDRLSLNHGRIADMAKGTREVALLPDPIGEVTGMTTRPNGLQIGKVRVPMGVIGIIYEARPNVTVDAAALCLKSGNATLLRGGKEAINSNKAIINVMQKALVSVSFPADCVRLVEDTSHETAEEMMRLNGYVDVLIPRGGKRLIESVVKNATLPVIETGTGNCHIYVDATADLAMATDIIVNAKAQRPGVCNAAETLLVHEAVYQAFLPMAYRALSEKGVSFRACEKALPLMPGATLATEEDWATEYLDYILAVRVVSDLDAAICHINQYNTGHSEAIVTKDYDNARRFHAEIDAAAVYVNASTRFTDGGCFGKGAEIGISTQKLHARGPMGLEELTTIKYIIFGNGQIR